MKKRFCLFLLFLPFFAKAQLITTEDYIAMYKDIAILKMKEYKIPASITLAQGILESASGNSMLAIEANNHFGIKCHKDWTGETYLMDDDAKDDCFRKYESAEESYKDHSLFLTTRSRYALLFDLDITDYKGWAKGLKAAGYATNPQYPQLLIKKIEDYNLAHYDSIALGFIREEIELEPPLQATPHVEPVTQTAALLAFSPDDKEAYELAAVTASGRFIYRNNGVKFVYAKDGETPESLAKEFAIYAYQLYDYNLFPRRSEVVFRSGDVVYLEPLGKRCRRPSTYQVQEGETLRDVALRFAVKLEKLQKYNKLKDKDVKPGDLVRLK
mgnify:FL=1